MLALVALTERFVDRHYLDFTNAAADNWSYWRARPGARRSGG